MVVKIERAKAYKYKKVDLKELEKSMARRIETKKSQRNNKYFKMAQ